MIDGFDFRGCRLFSDFTAEEFSTFNRLLNPKIIAEGMAVFVENMPGESLFVVIRGKIRLSKMIAEGEEKTLAFLGPGDFFGEFSLLDAQPRAATARVAEESELLFVKRSDYEEFSVKHPALSHKFMLNILRVFCRRVRDSDGEIRDILLWDRR